MKVETLKLPEFSEIREVKEEKTKTSFEEIIKESLKKVTEIEKEASEEAKRLVLGETKDLHSVMMAIEKADLTFQLMMQVRNKIIQAYEEIMRMQV